MTLASVQIPEVQSPGVPGEQNAGPLDPLSGVLALLRPRSYFARAFGGSGAWAVQFPRPEGIKCYAMLEGECWLTVEGLPPVRLRAGDCYLLPGGRAFQIATDLSAPVRGVGEFARRDEGGTTGSGGVRLVEGEAGGGHASMVGSYFALAEPQARLFSALLPPILHLEGASEQAALRWAIERMAQELRDPQPGGALMTEHLAHMMLLQALRLHLKTARNRTGWLYALADRRIGAALNALHADPARRWTVQALAEVANLSRSSFAARFRTLVGEAPLEYLTRWRMFLAADRLTRGAEPVAVIARSLGYESESAFSTAFKRVMGRSPGRYAAAQA